MFLFFLTEHFCKNDISRTNSSWFLCNILTELGTYKHYTTQKIKTKSNQEQL